MENKTIKTKNGHVVVLKGFITGREARYIQEVFMNDMEFKQENGKDNTSIGIKGSKLNVSQDRTIETMVISVDEKTEKVIDLVLDLPEEDFSKVIKEIDDITNPSKKEESTQTI